MHKVTDAVTPPYLVDVELALASGQFPVAGGELSNEVVTVKWTVSDKAGEEKKKKRNPKMSCLLLPTLERKDPEHSFASKSVRF